MMNQHHSNYIAEGFVDDVGKLMDDFLILKSVEFSDFAPIWRKHHFSLIFMGRPDHTETCEFVNEIFRLTAQYLLQQSFYQHVGAVFLLYALYQNQISTPLIKARVEKKHLRVINDVRITAFEKKYKSLHYIVEYLMDHVLLFVAHQTLRGPHIGGLPSPHDVSINKLKGIYKDPLNEYATSNNLGLIRDLHKQYLEEMKKLSGSTGGASVKVVTSHLVYEEAIKELTDFVVMEREREENAGVGKKKTNVKTQAFQKESKNKFQVISGKIDALNKDCPNKGTRIRLSGLPVKEKRETRPRKEDRRPGRPSKNPKPPPSPQEETSDEDEIDLGYLLSQQNDLFMPPVYNEVKKCRTKRDPYYQVSPKRVEVESDVDDASEDVDDPSND